MYLNKIEYTEHGGLSGLTRASSLVNLNNVKSVMEANAANAKYVANRACVYPYGGNEVQRYPIPGGYGLIAPLYNESGIRAIGGNVVYQKYLFAEQTVEDIHYSEEFERWAGKEALDKINSIKSKIDRFLTIYQWPWMIGNDTIETLRARCLKMHFVESRKFNEGYELTVKE